MDQYSQLRSPEIVHGLPQVLQWYFKFEAFFPPRTWLSVVHVRLHRTLNLRPPEMQTPQLPSGRGVMQTDCRDAMQWRRVLTPVVRLSDTWPLSFLYISISLSRWYWPCSKLFLVTLSQNPSRCCSCLMFSQHSGSISTAAVCRRYAYKCWMDFPGLYSTFKSNSANLSVHLTNWWPYK